MNFSQEFMVRFISLGTGMSGQEIQVDLIPVTSWKQDGKAAIVVVSSVS